MRFFPVPDISFHVEDLQWLPTPDAPSSSVSGGSSDTRLSWRKEPSDSFLLQAALLQGCVLCSFLPCFMMGSTCSASSRGDLKVPPASEWGFEFPLFWVTTGHLGLFTASFVSLLISHFIGKGTLSTDLSLLSKGILQLQVHCWDFLFLFSLTYALICMHVSFLELTRWIKILTMKRG
jgi:hypothetical protein